MSKIETNQENFKKYCEITSNINKLLNNIKKDTGGYSTHVHILKHPIFYRIN